MSCPRRRRRSEAREWLSCPVRPPRLPMNRTRLGAGASPTGVRRRGTFPGGDGLSLLENLVMLALLLTVGLAVLPAALDIRARAASAAAAREFANLFAGLRYRAVGESRHYGVFFEETAEGWSWAVYRDESGNGIRSRDIRAGREELVGGPWLVGSRWPGVDLATPPGDRPKGPPPSRSDLSDGDPVRFGSSDLVSFTPLGTASSGTLYLGTEERHWAVVLYGPTVRIRLWERRPAGWSRR